MRGTATREATWCVVARTTHLFSARGTSYWRGSHQRLPASFPSGFCSRTTCVIPFHTSPPRVGCRRAREHLAKHPAASRLPRRVASRSVNAENVRPASPANAWSGSSALVETSRRGTDIGPSHSSTLVQSASSASLSPRISRSEDWHVSIPLQYGAQSCALSQVLVGSQGGDNSPLGGPVHMSLRRCKLGGPPQPPSIRGEACTFMK